MTETGFLVYLPDPFAVQEPVFCLHWLDGQAMRVTAADVSSYTGRLITYDLPALVDELRRAGCSAPLRPIDLGEALRLNEGAPRDEGGERRWNIWRRLAGKFEKPAQARSFELAAQARSPRPAEPELSMMMADAGHALISLWAQTEAQLRKRGEYDRFFAVEVPVQSIFAHRQSVGIAVDRSAASTLLLKLEDEKYDAFQRVAVALGTNPTGLNFWNVGPLLSRTDAAHLADISDGGRLRDAFKLARNYSEFAGDFLRLIEATHDEVTLRRAAGLELRLHPVFSISGTVSSRILVSDPFIQQLRSRYRSIIAPEVGMRLVYIDYAQFEPGIMAYLTNDENLIRAYAKEDLYTELSKRVFGVAEKRSVAKRMFLAFSYGMTPAGIARLVASPQQSNELEFCQRAVEDFFSVFPEMSLFRKNMENYLLENGYVSSLFGNKRWRNSSGALTNKEKRWAVNQPIQATAALIFKEALIALAQLFGNDSIVLPMHDAVLLQFPDNDTFFDRQAEAASVMLSAFQNRCPNVQPKVTIGKFDSN